MDVIRSLISAVACFSRIPMPRVEWTDDSMKYMMCFFPLVGVAIGLAIAIWWWLADVVGFGPVARAIGVFAIPAVITGGIHLDGLADVADAQSSHAEPTRKHEILKDPHIGAFALIWVVVYSLVYVGFATELPGSWAAVVVLGCMHVMSRCASGVATVAFPRNAGQGMLAQFHDSAEKRMTVAVLAITFALALAVACIACLPAGLAIALGTFACLCWLRWFADSQYGGMSGDLAGFFLQIAELVMLVASVLVFKGVGL